MPAKFVTVVAAFVWPKWNSLMRYSTRSICRPMNAMVSANSITASGATMVSISRSDHEINCVRFALFLWAHCKRLIGAPESWNLSRARMELGLSDLSPKLQGALRHPPVFSLLAGFPFQSREPSPTSNESVSSCKQWPTADNFQKSVNFSECRSTQQVARSINAMLYRLTD